MSQLPAKPNLQWLRKQAKRRLRTLRRGDPGAQLAHAQFDLANDFGFTSWRDLKAHVDSLAVDGQMIVAAKNGDAKTLAALLDAHPGKSHLDVPPYDATLLHAGARHLAVVDLLLRRGLDPNAREKGADPLAVDGWGIPVAAYAESTGIDGPVMERIRALTAGELVSAARGHRAPNVGAMDLVASLALGDRATAQRLLRENPRLVEQRAGVLHLMAKRGDAAATRWLIESGADPSARWAHWDSEVTPLHLACLANHPQVVRELLEGGADPAVKDTKHGSDAREWAEFFGRSDILDLLRHYTHT